MDYKGQLMPQTKSSQAGCRLRWKWAWTETSGRPTSEVRKEAEWLEWAPHVVGEYKQRDGVTQLEGDQKLNEVFWVLFLSLRWVGMSGTLGQFAFWLS